MCLVCDHDHQGAPHKILQELPAKALERGVIAVHRYAFLVQHKSALSATP